MLHAKLLHNPGAGNEEHTEKELVKLIEKGGYTCTYASTKEDDWEEWEPKTDFLVLAGGDGTVRKVAKRLLNRRLVDKNFPLALLPLGTANNIAKTLGLAGETEDIIKSWQEKKIKKFDVGRIYELPDHEFFLESFGYGIFPRLMKKMKETKEYAANTPEEELMRAKKTLLELAQSYKAQRCRIEADGVDYSGNFILVEIMNARSIGPNLHLAAYADPGDGELEMVLVPESRREEFITFLKKNMEGSDEPFMLGSIKAKNIRMHWEGSHVHVDDELIKENSKTVRIELHEGALQFLV
ncbi:MAG: diacylglycerol kinase [Flavisolibacter sp.]|nr:diacylglycerol kinase [Flavisolibacter sp.]MBD0350017.1 diacylglycerol kinase [Flavisolibacter sp.]MBD0367830.1 diacylglycerol kinase [Flavisolibacter sp.]MBD0376382.1 diacylglycerol kinase [Flavisolibacter sp.]